MDGNCSRIPLDVVIKLVKWLRSFDMKQLAPPSLCSLEIVIKSKEDGGVAASQLSYDRY